ncbi:hypothetical protein GH714_021672 [Hevea brasiliensis]|uniref:Protein DETOXIFICATION n=1 Tax=Hevea brasiliensis TaxID=3981 RepID=A0A6A6M2H4_HEVBR|nr:hypothetical protein GH714_021672 [Hevea brasiliensis]
MLTKITQFGMLVVTQGFIGHIGEVELAAFALVQIITVRFVHGIVLGMSSATETLCGQAFGAKQYHMMDYLVRKKDTARKAGNISLWFIPSIYSSIFNFTVEKFLQAQLKNTIVGCLSSITFALHLLLSWILLIKLNLGIPGAMGAMIISNWLVVIGDFAYIFGGRCPKTWRGFTLGAFSDLVPILKLSLSSGLMLCLQLWYTAVLVLLAGYMKNAKTAISAFSICLNITAWDGMLCLGFLAAASVRVSNELGKEDAKAAKFSIKVNLTTSFCIGVFLWIMCLLFGQKIAHLFTSKKAVAEYVSSLLSLLLSPFYSTAFSQFFQAWAAVGAGRQSVVAYVNLFCYYAVGVPIGVTLGFAVHLQVKVTSANSSLNICLPSAEGETLKFCVDSITIIRT